MKTMNTPILTEYNPFVAHIISFIILIARKNRFDLLPANPLRFPILERFWQGEPNIIMQQTGGRFPLCIFVISLQCPMSGKWCFVIAIRDFSISLAQTGMIPLWEAARGNTPIPSNSLPDLMAHIDRLSFYFFVCCFRFFYSFPDNKKTPSMESPFNGVCCCL